MSKVRPKIYACIDEHKVSPVSLANHIRAVPDTFRPFNVTEFEFRLINAFDHLKAE